MKRLSVILAVYNKKDFVELAIAPFKEYQDIVELIVIDDNSSDGTSDIFSREGYSWINYERLSERKSTGFCRNLGMSKASGEYIGFLDGDDFVYLTKLLKLVDVGIEEGADVVCGRHIRYNYVDSSVNPQPYGIKIDTLGNYIFELESRGSDKLINLFTQVNATCWNKVFKLDFVRSNNLKFTDCCYMEDRAFTQSCLMMSSKTLAVDEVVYKYTISVSNETSISSKKNISEGLWRDYFKYIECLIETAGKLDVILHRHRVRDIFNVVVTEAVLKGSYIRGCINDCKELAKFDKMYMCLLDTLANEVHDRYKIRGRYW